jgi:hypothetical protein
MASGASNPLVTAPESNVWYRAAVEFGQDGLGGFGPAEPCRLEYREWLRPARTAPLEAHEQENLALLVRQGINRPLQIPQLQ